MKKIIAVLLSLVLVLSIGLLAGCGAKPDAEKKLVAKKVATMTSDDYYNMKDCDTAFISRNESDEHGLMSFDGTELLPTEYYIEAEKGYFKVSSPDLAVNDSDFEQINSMGLYNGKGEEIIPRQYGAIELVGDRYAVAYEAKGVTDDADKTIFSWNADWFQKTYDDDVNFAGTWTLYDLETAAPVEGVTGSTRVSTSQNIGPIFEYDGDDGEYHYVDPNGNELPEDADPMMYGKGHYYMTDENDNYGLYDIAGNKLFDIDEEGFVPKSMIGDYFNARKIDAGDYSYALMDQKGKLLTEPFKDGNFAIHGDYLVADNYLRDLSGNIVLDAEIERYGYDEARGKAFLIQTTDGKAIVFNAETKEVVYSEDVQSDHYYDFATCGIHTTDLGDNMVFTWPDLDYTVEGYTYVGMLASAEHEADRNNRLIDVTDNATLLDDYFSYTVAGSLDTTLRVYAETEDGNVDIYFLTME